MSVKNRLLKLEIALKKVIQLRYLVKTYSVQLNYCI